MAAAEREAEHLELYEEKTEKYQIRVGPRQREILRRLKPRDFRLVMIRTILATDAPQS